jgi:hypothetical protein
MKRTIGNKETWGEAWPPRGAALMESVKSLYGPRALLAFSRGKDATAAWLAMRDHFDDVVPVFFDTIPGISFVEESLDYFERFFGRKIYRLPHPSFYEMLRTNLFQTPSRIGYIAGLDLPPEYDFSAAHKMVREVEGLPDDVPCANGVRAADSPIRRVSLMKHGPISYQTRQWSPVWEWNKRDLERAFDTSGVQLPLDYQLFGRTLDGLDYRFMAPLKRERSDDYKRVLEWFPLVELELWRIERMA